MRMNDGCYDRAFQGPQSHRRHVIQKDAQGGGVLTAVEFVPERLDATNDV
jgi:hypothetical protein